MSVRQFSKSLRHYFGIPLSLHQHNATVSPGVEFREEIYFCPVETKTHYKLLRGTKFPGIAAIAQQLKP